MEAGDQEEQQFRTAYNSVPPHKAVNFKDVVREFMRGLLEMSVEFGRGCRDVVQQSLVTEDSFLVRNFGKDSYIGRKIKVPYNNVLRRLKLFNEYLVPEDKDPLHVWYVILFVFVLALAGIINFLFFLFFCWFDWVDMELHELFFF